MKTPDITKSLSEVNGSVQTNQIGWRKVLAFLGPAYLVSVGYMDPGNWATDIAGGSRYGYALLWVLLMSNMMAILLQSLSARLGIVARVDLAQASRMNFSPLVNGALWLLAEIAIAACDLAEVLGMAIGLQLLFGLPLIWGVSITVLDTLLLLLLQRYGMRKIEAFIITLVVIIGVSFLCEMLWAKPSLSNVLSGFVPSLPDESALYIAIGIIGATVMPHNLYLHSSLVQTRRFGTDVADVKRAIRFNFLDSVIALNAAFFVNAAILILAASTFFKAGLFEVTDIQDAYHFLSPLLGNNLAPIFFGIALVAAGQSSTITGTLAGQIVMEGYLNLRIAPWLRRLATRLLAIVPAYIFILLYGENRTGELLVFSQVVLSLQLGFAIIPLIHFTSDKNKMGEFAIGTKTKVAAWTIAIVIVGLNIRLVLQEFSMWLANAESPWLLWVTVFPVLLAIAALLVYIVIKPFMDTRAKKKSYFHTTIPTLTLSESHYKKISIAVDFSTADEVAIQRALSLGGKSATYQLIHVVETAGAMWYGRQIKDSESQEDEKSLSGYAQQLTQMGYTVEPEIGYGNPRTIIPEIVNRSQTDLLVMGAHGHSGWKDFLFGETVNAVRHRVHVSVFVVRKG